jgi:hypothetical protein
MLPLDTDRSDADWRVHWGLQPGNAGHAIECPSAAAGAAQNSAGGTKPTSQLCPKLRQWLTLGYRNSGVASNRRRCSLMA